MAAEYTGFIYVLSYRADTFEYHQMNIYTSRPGGYQPDRQYTDGHERGPADGRLLAQRLSYSLYYEVIPRLNPNNATPPPVTEPSVSLWTPCNAEQTCS